MGPILRDTGYNVDDKMLKTRAVFPLIPSILILQFLPNFSLILLFLNLEHVSCLLGLFTLHSIEFI